MNSFRCQEKEIYKKGHKSLLSVVAPTNSDSISGVKKDKRKGIPKDNIVNFPRLSIADRRIQSTNNVEKKADSTKKISCPNTGKRRKKNNRFLSRLQNGYSLQQSSSVGSFLQEHQELISLLNEAYRELKKYFLSEDLKLESISDPEIAGEQQLFVYISTSLSVTDALHKLDEFDEKWWLDRIDRANGLLNFNLRFV
jgi:hypothetical protein